MATTFVFEELDDATRNYLLDVRRRDGRGAPGVFIASGSSLPWVGFFVGPIIVVATLLYSLLSDQILNDPDGLALFQTAGVMLGGWMFVAAFRVWAAKNSPKVAGHWTYADPLYLYQAAGEQVTITPVSDLTEARATHNYQNGAYQNTAVVLAFGGRKPVNLSLANEKRAEALVVYYNYLAWARGAGEGAGLAGLTPALLGGVAKYVAKNESEPRDADNNINYNLIELEITDVPEEPRRDGRGGFHVVPYLVLVVLAVGFWFVMRSVVNVPFRDEAIYQLVTTRPIQPQILRSYLIDPRNTKYRGDIATRVDQEYELAVQHVAANAKDAALRKAMLQVLGSLRKADQPVVSIRVKEEKSPKGGDGGAAQRVEAFRTAFVKGATERLTSAYPDWVAPEGMFFTQQPTPMGEQLVIFTVAPDDADPHFDITYKFEPAGKADDLYTLSWAVAVRVKIDEAPVVKGNYSAPATYTASKADDGMTALAGRIANDMVGQKPANPPPFGGLNLPGGFPPGFNPGGFQP